MDADYDRSQNLQSELLDSTRKKKKNRRSKFATLVAKQKPKFDPKQFPSYKEYFDQYYSLDYEDMIGDLPCRFKYRKVVPNDYGLSVEEILMADDKELNKWCSLKRALQYKPEHVEMQEIQSYKQKATNEMFKQKILKSLYTGSEKQENKDASKDEETINNGSGSKKHRRKKKTKNNFSADSTINDIILEKKIAVITEDKQNNSHNIKNDTEQDKNMQKNIVNKNNEKKLKHRLKVDSGPRLKKIKMDNVKERSQIKVDNKIEKNNKETAPVDKTAVIPQEKRNKTKEKRKLQLDKVKSNKRESNNGNTDPIMSLNIERLKTYGINAKKFKNKLKYGKKKF